MTIRTLIVDDERIAREGVRTLLAAEPDIEVVGECGDGRSAVDAIARDSPDLVLLDIQMPVMDGFAVVRAAAAGGEERLPVVVFLTAYDQHSLAAFDAHALDYVVKPFSDERFRTAIARARRRVRERHLGAATSRLASVIAQLSAAPLVPNGDAPTQGRVLARIAVRSVGKTVYVRVADIVWIGAADYYAELHTRDGKRHLVRQTMQDLARQLDPSRFVRVHRSAIVAADQVAELRSEGVERHSIVLRDGTVLPLSQGRRGAVEAALARR